jgi:lactococcin 972 family bacteriocin
MKINRIVPAAVLIGIVASAFTPAAAQASTSAEVIPDTRTLSGEHGVEVPANGVSPRTTENVEGGKWEYGTSGGNVYSFYWHGSRKHASSVKNGNGDLRRSAETAKNKWAQVSFKKTAWGNQAFYRVL